MTGGFVAFGIGVPLYAVALRRTLPGGAWVAAMASGVATLGVALFPLDRSHAGDRIHGAFAGAGYAALAVTPLLAARPLWRRGQRGAAVASMVIGTASGVCLAATVVGPAHGLFQRLGLTLVDAWLVATAVTVARGHLGPRLHRPLGAGATRI
jgi:Na+/proline symporter